MHARIDLTWVAPWIQQHQPHGVAAVATIAALIVAAAIISAAIGDNN